jgi:glycosyltransferase involved in cell wall biosynthesis
MNVPDSDNLRVVYLAAGAAGMYCGSCIRDNRLAAALLQRGREITLIPLYTPLRTDDGDVSQHTVYYGGINVYLEQRSSLYRRLPRALTRMMDSTWLLSLAGRCAARTRPADVADLTVSVLRGDHGPQRVELHRLIDALTRLQPSLVNLPNLMFAGVARTLGESLHAPVVCTLSGEDIFLDQLPEPQRSEAFQLIREAGNTIDAFVATSNYYGAFAAEHFGLPTDRIHTVPLGLGAADLLEARTRDNDIFTIGYLARICPDKGLANLAEALIRLRRAGRNCRLRVAGYLAAGDRKYLKTVTSRVRAAGCDDAFEYLGEVSRAGKADLLRSLDVLSVPTSYREAKGLYVLEAMAAGVPVVQPDHGSFPELIGATGGGLLYEAGNSDALADALARLMDDSELRRRLAASGARAVRSRFLDRHMADETWALYTRVCAEYKSRMRAPS